MTIIDAALGLVGIATGILAGLFGFVSGFVIVPLVYHRFPSFVLSRPDRGFDALSK